MLKTLHKPKWYKTKQQWIYTEKKKDFYSNWWWCNNFIIENPTVDIKYFQMYKIFKFRYKYKRKNIFILIFILIDNIFTVFLSNFLKIEKNLKKKQNGFWRNGSTSQILTIRQILEWVCAKNLKVTLLFVDFSKAFNSIHRGKMELIHPVYSLYKETVTAIMMLYKNRIVKVHSLDGDSDFFDIVAGVLHEDALATHLFIICLDNILQTLRDLTKVNGFTLKKARSRWYPAQTTMDTDYADDIVLLANTPTQAESLLHSLKQAAGGIGLHVNADKMEHMCFDQKGDISTLNGGSLKLVEKFTYLGNSISSIENYINVTSKGMDCYW